jgi:hypothetical protein
MAFASFSKRSKSSKIAATHKMIADMPVIATV